MKHPFTPSIPIAILIAGLVCCPVLGGETLVATQEAYREAVKKARPGDTIVLANGQWPDFEILLRGKGKPGKPISLRAQTKGKVILTGQSNLRLSGEYLEVSGLVFKDGHSPTNTVIAFRRNKKELANHCRVTEVVIDRYNHPERFETNFWVMMYGQHNRFDHNHLVGKSNQGVTMAVRLDSPESRENHHRIDHNYFGPRPVLGSNGGETLRIGTSKYSLSDSFTVVENNVFDRCNGEVEIISSKSGGNIFRGNLFLESRGTLTLRHGNGNLIENNVFLGNRVDHTGGIRVINKRQTIRNNYLHGLTGHRFGGALVIMNGVPNSPINRYHQVEDSVIENNSIIACDHVELGAGSDAERSAPPKSTTFRNNLIANDHPGNTIAVYDDLSGIDFQNNLLHKVNDPAIGAGFTSRDLTLEKATNGLLYPTGKGLGQIGAAPDLKVLDKAATGVSWYPKPGPDEPFHGGKVIGVQPGERTLADAIAGAGAGDVIELAAGLHRIAQTLVIHRPLTIRSPQRGERASMEFERNALFEIADGGSLKLVGLDISGKSAPDMAGNTVVRTSRYSMLHNYRLVVEDATVSDLDTNHSFNFFTLAKHTFADHITIRNSVFRNITGHVLFMNRESEDLGIYNGEYVTIQQSRFQDIGGTIADIYRGGTDESTFGPHFELSGSKVRNVGKGKRNKSRASLHLHGVQATRIQGNIFDHSQPIRVMHTVGEPKTVMVDNSFNHTPDPRIEGSMPAPTRSAEPAGSASHPRLLLTPRDVALIKNSGHSSPGFQQSLTKTVAKVDAYFYQTPDVPTPADAGGGYTHEQHKRNGVAIHDAGILYLLTGKEDYANNAKTLLLAYAHMYPGLGEHPKKKGQTPGRLFWQSLNEAVWLVYVIQGYDAIVETLTAEERAQIEDGLLRPLASFLSEGQPQTFDKIHNHGTWAVAAVGMTGYVLDEKDWVQQALYGLKKDGQAGFIKQLQMLFSPDGYYNEGPYYQRYALMPFVLFAATIQTNHPELKIFEYRDNILLKAIYSCVDLSYAGLFFPINDAIKDKGLDTIELRYGIAIAYALTKDPQLLSIARQQQSFVLTGDGFETAQAIDAGLAEPFDFKSTLLRDGQSGKRGALAVLRHGKGPDHQALVFKATAQGMGHGHFDKLNWLFYDNSREIITDYGAARFLNVEQKNGGRYLPENKSWAKQTVAHNTLVVDEHSHFNGKTSVAEQYHPKVTYFQSNDRIQIVSAIMKGAYKDVGFSRTFVQLNGVVGGHPVIIDVLNAGSKKPHQYDLPLHFSGQVIASDPPLLGHTKKLQPLGNDNGYEHLWLRGAAKVDGGGNFSLTWLNHDRFYTYTALAPKGLEVLFTELGANDPHFNLRKQQALMLRVRDRKSTAFVSLLEPHGEYNGPNEFTIASEGRIKALERYNQNGADVIRMITRDGKSLYLGLSYDARGDVEHEVVVSGRNFTWKGFYSLFDSQGAAL